MDDVFVGVNRETRKPVKLPRPAMRNGHTLGVGMTSGGKTTLFAIPLAKQLMLPNELGEDEALVFFDLKGDRANWWHLHHAARALGKRCHLVSLKAGVESDCLDALQSNGMPLDPTQMASLMLEGCGINRGTGYGESWFADNVTLLALTAARDMRRDRVPETIVTASEYLRERLGSFRAAEHIAYAMGILTAFETIATVGPPDRQVRWQDVIEEGRVVYVHAPTLSQIQAAKAVNMLLQSLTLYMENRADAGLPRRHVHAIIDESHFVMNKQTAAKLALARDYGMSLHLLTQTLDQLNDEDDTVAGTILNSVQYALFFTGYGRAEKDFLQAHSVEVPRWLSSKNYGPDLRMTLGDKQILDYKLGHNDILASASTFGCALLVKRDQRGSCEPVPVYMEHTVPLSLHKRFQATPLPRVRDDAPGEPVRAFGWRHAERDEIKVQAIRNTFERIRAQG
jgi:hypothetical protein